MADRLLEQTFNVCFRYLLRGGGDCLPDRIFDLIMPDLVSTKSLLKLLVETESPSHDKAAVDRVGAIVAEEARKLGAQVEIIPNEETGDHVLSRFITLSGTSGQASAVEASGKDGILLLCHMDTVFP